MGGDEAPVVGVARRHSAKAADNGHCATSGLCLLRCSLTAKDGSPKCEMQK